MKNPILAAAIVFAGLAVSVSGGGLHKLLPASSIPAPAQPLPPFAQHQPGERLNSPPRANSVCSQMLTLARASLSQEQRYIAGYTYYSSVVVAGVALALTA